MNLFGWELRKATERPVAAFDLSGQANSLGAGELMGPGLPIAPAHPEEVEPRRWDYQPGRNLISAPRAYEPTSFAALRRLCDNYDVARLAIEARKDEARGWEWDIRVRPIPGMKREDQKARAAEFRTELETVRGFLLTPNQEDDFGTWLTMYLEDLFAIDAATLYLRPTRGGQLYGAEVVDGATIRPIVDAYGRVPEPPLPAYGQTIKGVTWTYFTRDELLYAPYHQSATSPYGFPPMEWILLTVNRALRRQTLDLSRYTEGTLPVAFYRVPKEWNNSQLAELQTIFDDLLAGSDLLRSRVRFVPGGEGTGLEPINPEPSTDVERWLMHLTAAAYGTSAYELGFEPSGSGLGGAGFGEASAHSTERRGSKPLAAHVKGILDFLIAQHMGRPELEFVWRDLGHSADLLAQAQRDEIYWKIGARGTDEIREDVLGLDPIGLGPTVFDPKLGVVLVSDVLAGAMTGEAPIAGEDAVGTPAIQKPASAAPGETTVGAAIPPPQTVTMAKAAELRRWRTKALRSVKDGRDPARFASDLLSTDEVAAISAGLAAASDAAAVRSLFDAYLGGGR